MYDRQHVKVTFEGDTGRGEDIWSTGIRVAPGVPVPGGIGEGTTDNIVASAADAWETFWDATSALIPAYFRTLSVKAAVINPNGRYPDEYSPSVVNLETPLVGGNTNASKAPQSTVVASLRSAKERGLATKGRMYLPINALGINGTTGRINTQSQIDTIGNAMVDFLGDMLGFWSDMNFSPVIMSNVGSGATNTISRVLIGDVLDTQRRRKNAYQEQYSTYEV